MGWGCLRAFLPRPWQQTGERSAVPRNSRSSTRRSPSVSTWLDAASTGLHDIRLWDGTVRGHGLDREFLAPNRLSLTPPSTDASRSAPQQPASRMSEWARPCPRTVPSPPASPQESRQTQTLRLHPPYIRLWDGTVRGRGLDREFLAPNLLSLSPPHTDASSPTPQPSATRMSQRACITRASGMGPCAGVASTASSSRPTYSPSAHPLPTLPDPPPNLPRRGCLSGRGHARARSLISNRVAFTAAAAPRPRYRRG